MVWLVCGLIFPLSNSTGLQLWVKHSKNMDMFLGARSVLRSQCYVFGPWEGRTPMFHLIHLVLLDGWPVSLVANSEDGYLPTTGANWIAMNRAKLTHSSLQSCSVTGSLSQGQAHRKEQDGALQPGEHLPCSSRLAEWLGKEGSPPHVQGHPSLHGLSCSSTPGRHRVHLTCLRTD